MRSCLLALTIGCVVASPLHAQFGIGKKIKTAAANAAGVPTASSGGGVVTGNVKFNDEVLEMTGERLGQLLKGLEAESQMLARMQSSDQERIRKQNEADEVAYRKASDDYDRKRATYERCSDPEMKRMESEMNDVKAGGPDSAALGRVAERIKAAQARGDMTELRRLADSVGRVGMAMSTKGQGVSAATMTRIEQKCGKPPVEPTKPTAQALVTASDIREAGLKASGFNDRQYAIMRERVLPYIQSRGKNSGGMMYSKGEAEALSANLANLSKYAELMQQY